MPPTTPRFVLTMDATTREALAFLQQRYGLTASAMVRLAVRRFAEAEGWQGKAAA
jgi:hypothetical protein